MSATNVILDKVTSTKAEHWWNSPSVIFPLKCHGKRNGTRKHHPWTVPVPSWRIYNTPVSIYHTQGGYELRNNLNRENNKFWAIPLEHHCHIRLSARYFRFKYALEVWIKYKTTSAGIAASYSHRRCTIWRTRYRYFDLIIIVFAKNPAKLRKTITHPGKDVCDSSVSRWLRTVGLGYVLSNLKVTTLQWLTTTHSVTGTIWNKNLLTKLWQ